MGEIKLDYKDFEEVTLGEGYELMGNRYYQNEVLTYAEDCGGNIIGIIIRELSLINSGFSGIKRIEIGFNWVNAWVSSEKYKLEGFEELKKEVNEILEVIIGKGNTDYLKEEYGYQIIIG